MGRPARPLHDPGNHRAIERGFVRQAACRSLTKPAKPAGDQEQPGTLTPPQGARSKGNTIAFKEPDFLIATITRTTSASILRNVFQKFRGGFVIEVLWDEFAAHGKVEHCLTQLLD